MRGRVYRTLVQLTLGLYRAALWRYPVAFRRTHGRDMLGDALRVLEERISRDGLSGWATASWRILTDLARPLPRRIGSRAPRRPNLRELLRSLALDLSTVMRSFRRTPRFSLLVVCLLSAGVALFGATSAVADAYLFEALPFPDAHRLVEVRPVSASVPWTEATPVFERSVAWELDGFTLVGGSSAEVVLGSLVSPDFFEVFGVQPAVGRTFDAEDVHADARVAVVSYDLWERRFGRDPSALGSTIRAYSGNGAEIEGGFTVIGVLPRDFWYLNRYTEILTPIRGPAPVRIGRLRSDVPPEAAERFLLERASEQPFGSGGGEAPRIRPLADGYSESVRSRLLALQAVAVLALVGVLANAALLLMTRADQRRSEVGLRLALGAGRGRIAMQLMGEGMILAAVAGIVGASVAGAAVARLALVIEARLGLAVPGGTSALSPDGSSLLATLAVAGLLGLLLGGVQVAALLPRTRGPLIESHGRYAKSTRGARTRGGALIATEVALAMTLLVGGAFMIASARHVHAVDLGFDPSGLSSYTIGFTTRGSDDFGRRIEFFENLMARVADLPTVSSAGLVRATPFASRLRERFIELEGGSASQRIAAVPQVASSEFFSTLALSVLRGRTFGEEDVLGTNAVAVLSESLTSRLWPGGEPLDQRIRFPAWRMPDMVEEQGPWLTVVGVVSDVVDQLEESRPTVYVPLRQAPGQWMTLLVRRRSTSGRVRSAIAGVIGELDPDVPIYASNDIAANVRAARAPTQFLAALLGTVAALSLGLAAAGLYGVATFATHRRLPELAVRMSLGADRGLVERLLVRETTLSVLIGLGLGAVGAHLLVTALRGQLSGVDPNSIGIPLASAVFLGAFALLAVWIPAHRASGSDLFDLLRQE